MSRIRSNTDAVLRAVLASGLEAVNTFCDTMADFARELTPYNTGNNKDSIETKTGVEGNKPVGRVYTQSGYGGWLEIGTSKMAARPYLAPAYQKAKDLTR